MKKQDSKFKISLNNKNINLVKHKRAWFGMFSDLCILK